LLLEANKVLQDGLLLLVGVVDRGRKILLLGGITW
jgi:hypothetical protein